MGLIDGNKDNNDQNLTLTQDDGILFRDPVLWDWRPNPDWNHASDE
jgi:hypothetical protein